MECSIYNPAPSLLMKHLVIGQRQRAPNFSAFHWSPHSSLVSIGQHFVTMNINIEIEIEADLNTEMDQTVWAMHSCNSWFLLSNSVDHDHLVASELDLHCLRNTPKGVAGLKWIKHPF